MGIRENRSTDQKVIERVLWIVGCLGRFFCVLVYGLVAQHILVGWDPPEFG
jgi:hypothetical protein